MQPHQRPQGRLGVGAIQGFVQDVQPGWLERLAFSVVHDNGLLLPPDPTIVHVVGRIVGAVRDLRRQVQASDDPGDGLLRIADLSQGQGVVVR